MVKTIERRALSDENTTIPIGKVYAEVKVAKVKAAEVKETEDGGMGARLKCQAAWYRDPRTIVHQDHLDAAFWKFAKRTGLSF